MSPRHYTVRADCVLTDLRGRMTAWARIHFRICTTRPAPRQQILIRAPLAPLAPLAPPAPLAPLAPLAPPAPVAPLAPLAPAPVAPLAPLAPLAPTRITHMNNVI